MKIYKSKEGKIIIVYSKDENPQGVVLVKDGGTKPVYNMFGGKVPRFAFHWANVWSNTAYTSTTNEYDIGDEYSEFKLVKKAKKYKNKGK